MINEIDRKELDAYITQDPYTPHSIKSSIAYCDNCGEYLGDYVNGVLYKFGQVVTQSHICKEEKDG